MPTLKHEWLRIAITAVLTLFLQRLWQRMLDRRRKMTERLKWEARDDLENVQACLLTSLNLNTCGRIEKRTVMTKLLSEIFTNEHERNMVKEAAEKTTDENPFVCSYLRMEDRWNVLVKVQNHLSSLFGPYHLFANQVSSYESCWYVFTLVGACSHGSGRFFITPRSPLKPQHDVASTRIRILLVNEQELRRICSGDISLQQEAFSERHQKRWGIMQRFAEVFQKQLSRVTRPQGVFDVRSQSWGANLCGTLKRTQDLPEGTLDDGLESKEASHEYNNFLRIHVPVPLLKETTQLGPQEVVLYE